MKAFLCELILSCVLAAPGAKPVEELTYGTLLYSYYQDDYAQALLEAEVAKAQGRRGTDPVRFDLATGSFAFSEGMYGMARDTFESVAASELTELDRMRLAFHLAREYHRRGDWNALALELDKIDLGKSWRGREKIHPEVEFMRAELAVQRGQLALAESALEKLESDDPLKAYGLFNLGVAYRAGGDLDSANRTFVRVAEGEPRDAESLDLIQRAKLAQAYVARQQHAAADAETVLGGLPGQGRYRDIALASYGGLAMENQDYALAARIWLTLQNQDYWTSSTAQARIGFPLSLERLASQDQALAQYRSAEQDFENRLAVIGGLRRQAQDPVWVQSLLQVFSAPERDESQMSTLVDRWQSELGHTDWLEWLATEDTHKVLLEWRELLEMQNWLDELPADLAAYESLAAERRRRSAAARELLHDNELLHQKDVLAAQIEAQSRQYQVLTLATAERTPEWMRGFADATERGRIDQLENMRELIRKGMSARESTRWLQRIDRLEGILYWELVEQREVRLRDLRKQLTENEQLLAAVNERIDRVQSAEAEFAAGVETDFLMFADRARELRRDVDRARNAREIALADQLHQGLAKEQERLERYLLITRIGIARATDQLALAADLGGVE
ncbi:MAG: hypothetical protein KDI31_06070 [Pseudomonadales bacterium]|nr:hypothetical protein [Pseudomonadales bacterium]